MGEIRYGEARAGRPDRPGGRIPPIPPPYLTVPAPGSPSGDSEVGVEVRGAPEVIVPWALSINNVIRPFSQSTMGKGQCEVLLYLVAK